MKKVKPKNTALLIIVLICAIVNSCASKQNSIQKSAIEETNPKLIFLNYKISEDSKGNKNIQFINKVITDGKLKNNTTTDDGTFGDLICNQLDKNSNVLQSVTIKNPLVKTFEYIDDSKQFKTKTVALKDVEFSLKLKLEPDTKHVIINEITQSLNEIKPLIKTKIY